VSQRRRGGCEVKKRSLAGGLQSTQTAHPIERAHLPPTYSTEVDRARSVSYRQSLMEVVKPGVPRARVVQFAQQGINFSKTTSQVAILSQPGRIHFNQNTKRAKGAPLGFKCDCPGLHPGVQLLCRGHRQGLGRLGDAL
jgi:hypothetical protein